MLQAGGAGLYQVPPRVVCARPVEQSCPSQSSRGSAGRQGKAWFNWSVLREMNDWESLLEKIFFREEKISGKEAARGRGGGCRRGRHAILLFEDRRKMKCCCMGAAA